MRNKMAAAVMSVFFALYTTISFAADTVDTSQYNFTITRENGPGNDLISLDKYAEDSTLTCVLTPISSDPTAEIFPIVSIRLGQAEVSLNNEIGYLNANGSRAPKTYQFSTKLQPGENILIIRHIYPDGYQSAFQSADWWGHYDHLSFALYSTDFNAKYTINKCVYSGRDSTNIII